MKALLWIVPVVSGGIAYYASALVEPVPVAAAVPALASSTAPASSTPGAGESVADAAGENTSGKPQGASRKSGGAYDPQRFTEAISKAGRASRISAYADLLETLNPADFPRVFDQVMRLPSDERDSLYLHILFQARQRADRAAAIAGLAAIPDKSTRNGATTVLVRAWARSDVAAARAWAEKNMDNLGLMGFNRYADQLEGRKEVPKTSIEEILKNPDRKARSSEISSFIGARAKEAPLAAANMLKSIPEESERRSAAFTLVVDWTNQNPMEAARWFLSPEARQLGVSEIGFGHLAKVIAEKDPKGSLELVRLVDLTAGEGFGRLHVQQILSIVYAKEPQAVMALLQDPQFDRPDFPERYRVLALHDPQLAFKDAIEKFIAETDRTNRFHRRNGARIVLEEVAQKSPAQAASLALSGPPELYPNFFGQVGEIWAKTDAAAAGAWAAKLPPGKARDDASREFVFHWAKSDSNRAATWLDSIPKGTSRDEAIFGFACATMDLDPNAALAWTRSMTNPERRDFVIARAWQIWARENASAAEKWLAEEPTLTDADRDRMRTQK